MIQGLLVGSEGRQIVVIAQEIRILMYLHSHRFQLLQRERDNSRDYGEITLQNSLNYYMKSFYWHFLSLVQTMRASWIRNEEAAELCSGP